MNEKECDEALDKACKYMVKLSECVNETTAERDTLRRALEKACEFMATDELVSCPMDMYEWEYPQGCEAVCGSIDIEKGDVSKCWMAYFMDDSE